MVKDDHSGSASPKGADHSRAELLHVSAGVGIEAMERERPDVRVDYDQRGSEPVTIAMLRDSGVLEESLDFLLGAWRPGKASDLNPADALNLRDVMRVAILKNRKGLDGRVVDLRFRPDSRRLYEESDPFAGLEVG